MSNVLYFATNSRRNPCQKQKNSPIKIYKYEIKDKISVEDISNHNKQNEFAQNLIISLFINEMCQDNSIKHFFDCLSFCENKLEKINLMLTNFLTNQIKANKKFIETLNIIDYTPQELAIDFLEIACQLVEDDI